MIIYLFFFIILFLALNFFFVVVKGCYPLVRGCNLGPVYTDGYISLLKSFGHHVTIRLEPGSLEIYTCQSIFSSVQICRFFTTQNFNCKIVFKVFGVSSEFLWQFLASLFLSAYSNKFFGQKIHISFHNIFKSHIIS